MKKAKYLLVFIKADTIEEKIKELEDALHSLKNFRKEDYCYSGGPTSFVHFEGNDVETTTVEALVMTYLEEESFIKEECKVTFDKGDLLI